MSNIYENYLGITFIVNGVSRHSFGDFGLYPYAHPEIRPAAPKTHYVDIPAADGSIDMTEALQGYVTYKTRTGRFVCACVDMARYDTALTDVCAFLHGKEAYIVMDEEPEFKYHGRLTVDKMDCDAVRGIITITAELEPFKRALVDTAASAASSILGETISAWKWDPFNFIDGVIRDYHAIAVTGTDQSPTEVTVVSSPAGGSIRIHASASGMKYAYNPDGGAWPTPAALSSGWNSLPEVLLPRAVQEVKFRFSGSGTVKIEFTPGYL